VRDLLIDALGSTLALADGSGAVQTSYTYEPFGLSSASGTSSTNAAQFTGRENDGTGLYFYRARYYSPGFQRFISEDPVDFLGGSVNLYSYVRNSPSNVTDPLGLWVRNRDPRNPVPVKREEGPWGKLPPCMEYPGSPDGWLSPGKNEGPPWYKVPGTSWLPDNNVEIGPGDTWVCIGGPCRWPRIPLLNPGPQVLPAAPDRTWIPPADLPDLPGIRPIPGCKPKGSKSDQ
jgi:RHS repeat-associated protein